MSTKVAQFCGGCPNNLCANSNTDFGKIKGAEPIKIQVDLTKPLPKLPGQLFKPEPTIQGRMSTADNLAAWGSPVPVPAPRHTYQASPET